MKTPLLLILVLLGNLTTACGAPPKDPQPETASPAVAPASEPAPPAPPEVPAPPPITKSPYTPPPVAKAKTAPPSTALAGTAMPLQRKGPPPAPEGTWVLKHGKLTGGSGTAVAPKLLSQIKNPKGSGSTRENCWNFDSYAVVEMKSTDELGSAEITLRYPGEKKEKLCAKDFDGRQVSLKIREVYFAGVAGDYVVADGADLSEGATEFQIFSVATGGEVYRGLRHPAEGFSVTKSGHRTSLEFHAPLKVKCELGVEGEPCWKRILKDNGVRKPMKLPDCKAGYAKSKTPLEEPALVCAPARVANIERPKLEWLGGTARCEAAP